ncbi:hypothetical protein PSTT_08863, partial [Puccinia striiformis]
MVGESQQEALLLSKSEGILAGVPFFDKIFDQLGCKVQWKFNEGDLIPGGRTIVAIVWGKARCLLIGKRVGLNSLARCSGIATQKTSPGFRLVEKYGMLVGGIDPHCYDLSSTVMLKDNHIWSNGSITVAIQAARS